MSTHEKQPHGSNPEQQRKLEAIRDASDKLKSIHEKELTKAEKSHGEKAQVEKLTASAEKLTASAEKHAAHKHEAAVHVEREQPKSHHPVYVNKHLKDTAYTRALTRAQKRLSTPGRVFSKVVHNDVVDRASEVVGNTVARPSGMLGGALFAFIGTSALLWVTRHFGYDYNYLAVILLFVFGMATGLLLESLLSVYRRRSKS